MLSVIVGNDSGSVGLAITQALSLTGMFQWCIKQTTELENDITSVERVLEYNLIDRERERVVVDSSDLSDPTKTISLLGTRKIACTQGKIEFRNVSLRYSSDDDDAAALSGLTFTVLPGEKVGIVGRTGAGKSSLINAIFQLTETDGTILIDDIDVDSMHLQELRSNISIIPQEPVLFSGTMRKNLDPFDEYADTDLWRALDDVELKNVVAKDMLCGLDSIIHEGGSNFSVGQRQLICLARASLRNNRILILDEATANVDPQTDSLIQTTIRNKFAGCTVLTVAHRLHTVMDSDRIMVMEAGRIQEFGHPFELLQNKHGMLYGMVLHQQADGHQVVDEGLVKIAKDSFQKIKLKSL